MPDSDPEKLALLEAELEKMRDALAAHHRHSEAAGPSLVEAKTPPSAAHHGKPKPRKNPRMGAVELSGKQDEAAKFNSKKEAAKPVFDPAEVAEELDLWWLDGDGDKFYIKNGKGGWSKWPKTMVYKAMREMPGRVIQTKYRDGDMNAEADQVLLYAMRERRLDRAIPALAGYPAGVYDVQGERVMVLAPMRIVEAEKGEWAFVKSVIESRLGAEQSRFFHSWTKVAYGSLINGSPGNYMPGQALIFVGGAGSGKSRLQHNIITPMLGGRSGNPKKYLFGTCDFNDNMIKAEHILMEDPCASTKLYDRVIFGEAIKEAVVNDTQRMHPKGKSEFEASPFWRLSISVNDDPDKLRVLPPITPDIEDKLMIFRVSPTEDLPQPETHLCGSEIADELDRRRAFRERINQELPAYAWWLLNEFEIPEDIKGRRFGVEHYHDESLRGDMFEDSPANELMALLDAAEFTRSEDLSERFKLWELPEEVNASTTEGLWWERALTLESLLTGEHEAFECSVAVKAKQYFRHNNITKVLPRLHNDVPERFDKRNKSAWKGWTISRPILSNSDA